MSEAGVQVQPPVGAFDLGTDPAVFSPASDTRALRKRWGVGDDPLVLTVARLVPHKGQDTGIRALASLSGEFPDLRYVLVGEGHDEARLRLLASELGVAGRVVFAGPIPDEELPEAYATSTVYLGASRIDNEINVEGFGIAFLEASASGVPVVAGDSGGVRSAVRDGETGVVVPPEDHAAIARAIADFLRDEERRRTFGAAGRRAVESHFNWDRVARDTREFALQVTRSRRPAR
jgi:phosphatidylinositol alpha-1,6-mannosyltransferase